MAAAAATGGRRGKGCVNHGRCVIQVLYILREHQGPSNDDGGGGGGLRAKFTALPARRVVGVLFPSAVSLLSYFFKLF